jgi:hypothetical protein
MSCLRGKNRSLDWFWRNKTVWRLGFYLLFCFVMFYCLLEFMLVYEEKGLGRKVLGLDRLRWDEME